MKDRRNNKRRFLFKLLLLLTSSIARLLLLEVAIRLLLPVYDPSGHLTFVRGDSGLAMGDAGFEGRQWKNTGDYDVAVRINELGFRDTKQVNRASDSDIVVVGDSFSFGWGVEQSERYSDRLERMLDVPVYNIAIPADLLGYQRLVRYAERNGATIGRLIIGVCMENDLLDYQLIQQMLDSPPTSERNFRELITGTKAYLTANSASYNAITSVVHQNPALKRTFVLSGLLRENIAGMSRNELDENVITSSVETLVELARQYETTVVIVPSRGLWVGGNQEAEHRVHDTFVTALRERLPDVIDMRPTLESGKNPLQFHFENDGHWNAQGHKMAAATIARSLR